MEALTQTLNLLTKKIEGLVTRGKKLEEENQFLLKELNRVKEELNYTMKVLKDKKRIKKKSTNNPKLKKIVVSISKHFDKEKLLGNSKVDSLALLSESNIVTGIFCSLCIWDINCSSKTIEKVYEKEKAHDDNINYINIINQGKELLSCSSDTTIKLWNTSNKTKLKHIGTFKGHTELVSQVIYLENDKQIVSCSPDDHTIKIWDINKTKPLKSISEDQMFQPSALLQLKDKSRLLVNCFGYICTYSTSKFKQIKRLEGLDTGSRYGLLEVGDDYVAVSQDYPPKISLVKVSDLTIVNEIKDKDYISGSGALAMLSDNYIVYVKSGNICQLSFTNNKLKLDYKKQVSKEELDGHSGIIVFNDFQYFVTNTDFRLKKDSKSKNRQNGITVYNIRYSE